MHTMPRTTYSEKLKDPRWQRKRLEILNRDGFACRECGTTTETLHVHHCFYTHGLEPWQYPEFSLLTLCHECHEARQDMEKEKIFQMKEIFAHLNISEIDSLVCDLGTAIVARGNFVKVTEVQREGDQ